MITKLQQNQIRKMIQSDDGWDALELALADYIDRLNAATVSGANAFETLRDVHRREGGVEHLKAFFNQVETMKLSPEE